MILFSLAAAPTVSVGTKHVILEEGDTLDAVCSVSGSPKPSISWRRIEGALSLGNSEQLVKMNMEPGDSGNYECVAKNYVGEARGRVIVIVRGNLNHRAVDCKFKLNFGETILGQRMRIFGRRIFGRRIFGRRIFGRRTFVRRIFGRL